MRGQIELHVSKSQLLSQILTKQLFANVTSGADKAMVQRAMRHVIWADFNTALTGKGGLVAGYVETHVGQIVHTNSNTATLASALSDLDASIRKLQQQEQQLLQQGQTMKDNDPDRISTTVQNRVKYTALRCFYHRFPVSLTRKKPRFS